MQVERNALFFMFMHLRVVDGENVFAPFNRFVKFTTHLEVSGKVSIAGAAATFAFAGTAELLPFSRASDTSTGNFQSGR